MLESNRPFSRVSVIWGGTHTVIVLNKHSKTTESGGSRVRLRNSTCFEKQAVIKPIEHCELSLL